MAMYEISPLQGFNENGFRVEKPLVRINPSDETSQDESILVYKVVLTFPKKETDQASSESTQ